MLRFDEVVLAPPWPAASAMAVLLGVFRLALFAASRIDRTRHISALNVAASFVGVTAAVAASVQALALMGLASPFALRCLGGALATSSLGLLTAGCRTQLRGGFRAVRMFVAGAPAVHRVVIVASGVTVLALVLSAFGPATDIDSLTYHLSLPLDWLAHDGVRATPDWLSARLVGAGESLNLLGLALGTDCLGAGFQAMGILVSIAAAASVAATALDTGLALVLVASCPLLPFLTTTSKPQLLPASATAVALALLVAHRRTDFSEFRAATLWLIFACVSFAMACKYSFIPSGLVVGMLVLVRLWRTPWRRQVLLIWILVFAAIAAPVYLRNFLFYGDPLSPVLEGLRPSPDPVVGAFSWYLRNFSGSHSLRHFVRLPWEFVVAARPGQLTSVLGIGALAVFAGLRRRDQDRDLLQAAAVVTVIGVTFGQLAARFFFEPYLWCAMAAVAVPWNLRKRLLHGLLAAQMCITVPVSLYAAYSLAPAAISASQRERVLTRFAADYALSGWLDGVLAADAVVATDRGSSLFSPRPTVHADLARMIDLAALPDPMKRARLMAALTAHHANTLVVTGPVERSPYRLLLSELGPPVRVSPVFADAVRNPWRRYPAYQVEVYDLRALIRRADSR